MWLLNAEYDYLRGEYLTLVSPRRYSLQGRGWCPHIRTTPSQTVTTAKIMIIYSIYEFNMAFVSTAIILSREWEDSHEVCTAEMFNAESTAHREIFASSNMQQSK